MTAWRDLTDTFTRAELALPPVPEPLRSRLTTFGRWHWGTREHDRLTQYMFDRDVVENLLTAQDEVSVSQGGHGSNSYAITFCLAYQGLVIATQVGWGGVYMDKATQRARLAEVFTASETLLAEAPAPGKGWRLVCVASELRRFGACAWARADQPLRLETTSGAPVEVFTAARTLLRSGPLT